jgi:hypothetical protein
MMRRTLHQEYLMMVLLGYMVMWVNYELCRIVESTGDTPGTTTPVAPGTVRMDRSSGDSLTPPFKWLKDVWAVEIKNVERETLCCVQTAGGW